MAANSSNYKSNAWASATSTTSGVISQQDVATERLMRRIVIFALLVILAVAGTTQASAQLRTPQENARASRKAAKKQQKYLKKANKQQKKATKKALKAQRKENKRNNQTLHHR
jgi:hypothetical protein